MLGRREVKGGRECDLGGDVGVLEGGVVDGVRVLLLDGLRQVQVVVEEEEAQRLVRATLRLGPPPVLPSLLP